MLKTRQQTQTIAADTMAATNHSITNLALAVTLMISLVYDINHISRDNSRKRNDFQDFTAHTY
jgi:hypothetical protein